MNTLRKTFFVGFLLFAILLTGCTGVNMSFSPEQAAVRAVTEPHGDPAIVDQSSVQVHQSVAMGKNTFVVISYNQLDGARKDKCTFVYTTQRSGLGGWLPAGGGGGCTGMMPGDPEPPQPPLELGAGTGSSGPNDLMHSYVYGLVHPTEKGETIARVRVTWKDGQQQEVNVINGSYLAVRAGEFQFENVEGLDASGNVVYKFNS